MHISISKKGRPIASLLLKLHILVCFLWQFQVSAQTGGASSQPTGMTPPIKLMAVGYQDDLKILHALDRENKSTGAFFLPLRSMSSPREFPYVEGLIRFAIEDGVNEIGETKYKVVATLSWDKAQPDGCMVFIPKSFTGNEDQKMPYLLRVMDMSENNFKQGTTRVFNFSPVTGYLKFGEHNASVQPYSITVIPQLKELLRANMAQLSVYHLIETESHTVMEKRIRYLEDIRYLIILYPDFRNKRMGVAAIVDRSR